MILSGSTAKPNGGRCCFLW